MVVSCYRMTTRFDKTGILYDKTLSLFDKMTILCDKTPRLFDKMAILLNRTPIGPRHRCRTKNC